MKNMSLYNKIFIIFTITLLISVSLIGWFGIESTTKAYVESVYELSQKNVQALNVEIEKKLEYVPKDVLYSANFYALKKFLVWNAMDEEKKAEKWKQIFSDALVDFLDTRKDYYKARIIDVDGNEMVSARYDKDTDKTVLISDSELQNKKGRDYVEKTKLLKKGEFYVSHMNLNIENGKIEKPYTPVIRFATPIIDSNNDLVGIFVTSVYADMVLNIIDTQLKLNAKKDINYFLIDTNGDYLYNKDKTKRWNHQLKHGFNFNKEFFNIKDKFKDKDSGIFSYKNKIYSFHKLRPIVSLPNNYWYIVSSIDEAMALSKLDNFKIIFAIIFILVILASIFIVRIFVLKITTPLSKVTEQLKALSNGKIQKEHIIYDSNDEIGEIVDSTVKLVDAIETTIKQANAVANGEFIKEIKLLSNNDELGLAIQSMTLRLKEITNLAQSLSFGDYDVKVIAKSSEDKLGLALIDMIDYLSNITKVAESIALGELNIKYKVKGEDDRLGRAILQMIKYLRTILRQADAISKDNFSNSIEAKSKNDELSSALITMTQKLRDSSIQNKNEIYFSEGIGKFSDSLSGVNDTIELSRKAIVSASRYVNASSGVLYSFDKDKSELNLIASFAYTTRNNLSNNFRLGEGIVGQVALEKEPILIKNIKDDEYIIQSGTTISKPKEVYAIPLVHEDELFGVMEMMSYEGFTKIHKNYLSKISSICASALHTTNQNVQIKILLEKSQEAYEELQTQSEELQETNVQMEEQQQQLTIQSQELQVKNETLAQAKQEIDKRAEELEKASKYKSEFLANMSHELRTPLNSIILLSKLLTQNQNKTLNAKDVEKSKVIHKAGNDLLLLINDILDLSKIESGNMELIYEDIATSDIVDEMKGLFGAIADDKGLDFIINDEFKSYFYTDKTKLSQIIKNLLSNAFKFTKEGSVSIKITNNINNIIFTISDTGIGIPKEKLITIFEAFKQVDGSISREFGGTGLGLSITKTIVDLMDGVINVESEVGNGTSFTVTLPLNIGKNKILKESKIVEDKKVIESKDILTSVKDSTIEQIFQNENDDISYENELIDKHILIVDDDSRNIFTLTSTLENMDAEVYSAFNGQEALEILEDEETIDLILMDIMMPVMDGLSAIKSIKADERFKDIPIIAITAKTMLEDRDKCLDAGASDYLQKPLKHNSLISMIKAWIQ